MGASASKSETFVSSILEAGISVMNEIVMDPNITSRASQSLVLDGCTVDSVKMSQMLTVNYDALATAIMDASIDQKIDSAVKAAAEASSQAGIGLSAAEAKTVVDKSMKISTAITQSVRASLVSTLQASQKIECKNSTVHGSMTMEQDVTSAYKIAIRNEQVAKAVQDVKEVIDASSAATAKGMDPMSLILIILGIGAVVTFGGVGFVGKILGSPAFWMVGCGLLSAVATYFAVCPLIPLWPGAKVDTMMDTPTNVASKKKRNKVLMIAGGVTAAATGLGAVGLLIYIIKSRRQT